MHGDRVGKLFGEIECAVIDPLLDFQELFARAPKVRFGGCTRYGGPVPRTSAQRTGSRPKSKAPSPQFSIHSSRFRTFGAGRFGGILRSRRQLGHSVTSRSHTSTTFLYTTRIVELSPTTVAALVVRNPAYLARVLKFHSEHGQVPDKNTGKAITLQNMLHLFGIYQEVIARSDFMFTVRQGSHPEIRPGTRRSRRGGGCCVGNVERNRNGLDVVSLEDAALQHQRRTGAEPDASST